MVIPCVKYFWNIRRCGNGHGGQGGSCHDQPIVCGIRALKGGDPQRNGLLRILRQHDQLQGILIPCIDKGEGGQGAKARLDQGHDHTTEGTHLSRPINPGRLQHLGGDRLGKLLHQEHAKGPAHHRQITAQGELAIPKVLARDNRGIRMTCLGRAMAHTNREKMNARP